MNAINIWENWTEGYRVFKTTYKEDMKHDCEDDGIEEEIWSAWYQDWQQLRYAIELKMQPVIERGLKALSSDVRQELCSKFNCSESELASKMH